MTEQTLTGRRTRNQTSRLALDEARAHGLAQRHLRKLMRLARNRTCDCPDVHRHSCSYADVLRHLESSAAKPDSG
jgi:hypothetical protein